MKLFISYRRDDSDFVPGALGDRLKTHFGRDNVFLDFDNILLGTDFRTCLRDAISRRREARVRSCGAADKVANLGEYKSPWRQLLESDA